VADSETEAGERTVDLPGDPLDVLKLHRADASYTAPTDYVFATKNGTSRNAPNVTRQILKPAIDAANVEFVKAGHMPSR
jgi:hypothetical protein